MELYISCGLTIQSEVELPELFTVKDVIETDIRILLGDVHA